MRVCHPKFPDNCRDVPEAEVDNWAAQGWIPDAPMTPSSDPTPPSEATGKKIAKSSTKKTTTE